MGRPRYAVLLLLLLFPVFLAPGEVLSAGISTGSNLSRAPQDPAQTPVNREAVSSEQNLVLQSDLIVQGRLEESSQAYPTGATVEERKILHYVQQLRVEETWKGTGLASVNLLTSGVDPLPDADNPLNKSYTGPLTAGEYVFFLRKSGDYYTLTGLWQGLYPLFQGKSVALLANGGFASFDQLPVHRFRLKVLSLAESSSS